MCEDLPPSKEISTVYTYDTEYCADSLEWCPIQNFKNIFVCSSYQLNEDYPKENNQKRIGRIQLFSVTPECGLKLLQTINAPGILDQKWCHHTIDGYPLLGVVNSVETIEIYKLDPETIQLELVTSYSVERHEPETLLLSLDWSTGKTHSDEPEVICSDSNGRIHIFSLKANQLVLWDSWQPHTFEAWIAAFYYWDTNIVFSGGDDSMFYKFDKRLGTEPVGKNKSHCAGVTAIHSNSKKEYILATGSYDATVRLWDIRNMRTPTSELNTPGPVWRLKWDPFSHRHLLAACMLGGVHIVDATNTERSQIVESYYEHKSIAYGVDWAHLPAKEVTCFDHVGNVMIGSCSFYDHLLCVAKVDCDFT